VKCSALNKGSCFFKLRTQVRSAVRDWPETGLKPPCDFKRKQIRHTNSQSPRQNHPFRTEQTAQLHFRLSRPSERPTLPVVPLQSTICGALAATQSRMKRPTKLFKCIAKDEAWARPDGAPPCLSFARAWIGCLLMGAWVCAFQVFRAK
jgi:hypothetical protein